MTLLIEENPAATMDAFCASLFAGPLDFYAGKVVFRDDRAALGTVELADRDVFDSLLDRFTTAYPTKDRQAVASYWSQHLFANLTIPLAVLSLAPGRPFPLDWCTLRVRFCPEKGTPTHLHLSCGGSDRSGPDHVRALFEEQITPLVSIIKRHSGLSSRLLFENAGTYTTWILHEIAHARPALEPDVTQLLGDETWPRAACSAMTHLKRAAIDDRLAVRRLCCLRYRLPGVDRCAGTCPLAPEANAP